MLIQQYLPVSLVAAQFLPVVLIIMLYKKLVVNFENMDGKLAFDHLRMKAREHSFSVVLCVYFVVIFCKRKLKISSRQYCVIRKYFVPVVHSLGGYGDDPCSNFRTLSGADRAAGFRKLTNKSNKRSNWREDWYRFTGKAGDEIASM